MIVENSKALMCQIVEKREIGTGSMLVQALRAAAQRPKENQIGIEDIGWYLVAAVAVAEEIETYGRDKTSDYGRMIALTGDSVVRNKLIKRLKGLSHSNHEIFKPWIRKQGSYLGTRAEKLVLLFAGELGQALKPLPEKIISWSAVANIANTLTNQLEYVPGVNPLQAHVASQSCGGRRVNLEAGRTGIPVENRGSFGGWEAFDEEDISQLFFKSATSGNSLEVTKLATNQWSLTFTPSAEKPMHKGVYLDLYKNAYRVTPIKYKKPDWEEGVLPTLLIQK